MTQLNDLWKREIKASDVIVDGLFKGVVAGLVMGVYLGLAGFIYGESPLSVLGRFDPAGDGQPLVGLLAHLAVSAIYGAMFGLISLTVSRLFRMPAWLPVALGAAYGLLLVAVAWFVLLPGMGSPLLGIPLLHFSLGHLVYGLVLGWLAVRAGFVREQ